MPSKGPLSWLNSTGFERSEVREFWSLDEHDIPPKPGAYVLLAEMGTRFPYPKGASSVFYVGQSQNLKSRLELHLKFAREAADNRKENLYWPRYEYAAKFGCRYVYLRTRQGMTPKGLGRVDILDKVQNLI